LDANHPANFRDCEAYLQEKEIIRIKIDKRISRREAIRVFRSKPMQLQKSFAESIAPINQPGPSGLKNTNK